MVELVQIRDNRVDKEEFNRRIRAINDDAKARLGSSHLPDAFRRCVESHALIAGEFKYIEGDDQESAETNWGTVCVYGEMMEKYVEASLSLGDSVRRKPKATQTKIYPKTFERRLHLLGFVLKRKGDGRARKGFWKTLAAEWNHEHPHDQRTPEDLKTRYSEYVNNSDLWNSYVAANMAPVIREAIMASASLSGTGKLTCSATVTKAIRETPLRVKEVKHDRKHNEKR